MTEERKLADNCNELCYCGRMPSFYDGFFESNFCSDDCVDRLRAFFAHSPSCGSRIKQKVRDAVEAGDFKIQGSVVTLLKDDAKASRVMQRIEASVDKVVAALDQDAETRKKLKKMGLDDATIEAMIIAQKEIKS